MDKIQQKKDIEMVASLLKKDTGRFSNYQKIPEFVLEKIPDLRNIDYCQSQMELDTPRYKWLKERYRSDDFTVVEIGANLGYFAMTLAEECNARATVYEPIAEYAEVCRILCRVLKLQDKIQVSSRSIAIDDLESISSSDLIIHLNVLHHAGSSFDVAQIDSISDWHRYAHRYLRRLSKKASYLFFQTGNMWKNKPLFPSETTLSLIANLLEDSNWVVEEIGVIEDLSKMHYKNYHAESIEEIPRIYCRRNQKTNLVEYYREGRAIGSCGTGSAQRPLWFCRSKHDC